VAQENRSGGKAQAKTPTDKQNSDAGDRGDHGARFRARNGTASYLLKPGHTTTANGTTFVRPPESEAGLWGKHAFDGDPLDLVSTSGDARYAHGLVHGAVGDERIKQRGISALLNQRGPGDGQDLSELRGWQPEVTGADPKIIALLRTLNIR
jgi:hypothetical protein